MISDNRVRCCAETDAPIVTIPTIGFNVESFVLERRRKMTVWDIGGTPKIRPLMAHYIQQSEALILVVDLVDRATWPEAREIMLSYLHHEQAPTAGTMLVLGTKADFPDAGLITELVDALQLKDLRTRWYIEAVGRKQNLRWDEGFAWLSEALESAPSRKKGPRPSRPVSFKWACEGSHKNTSCSACQQSYGVEAALSLHNYECHNGPDLSKAEADWVLPYIPCRRSNEPATGAGKLEPAGTGAGGDGSGADIGVVRKAPSAPPLPHAENDTYSESVSRLVRATVTEVPVRPTISIERDSSDENKQGDGPEESKVRDVVEPGEEADGRCTWVCSRCSCTQNSLHASNCVKCGRSRFDEPLGALLSCIDQATAVGALRALCNDVRAGNVVVTKDEVIGAARTKRSAHEDIWDVEVARSFQAVLACLLDKSES